MSDTNTILDQAIHEHDPSHVFGLFSGGHDSLTATHVASQHPAFTAAVHVNTGIGIPQTREFVRDTCKDQGWPLIELHPPDKTYDEMVLENGFPGPGAHRYVYSWLKERAVRLLVRRFKQHRHDRIILVTGVRAQESQRRMGHVKPIQRNGSQVWVAPLIDWSALDCRRYMAENDLTPNEVVDLIHMSGECLCGAYARPHEFEAIETWFPDVAERIRQLEVKAKEAGVDHCRWGWKGRLPEGQLSLDLPMCHSCEARLEGSDVS